MTEAATGTATQDTTAAAAAAAGGQSDPAAASGGAASTSDNKPKAPEGLSDWWDGDKGELRTNDLAAHVKALTEIKTADEVRRRGIPEKAEDYKAGIPAGFKLPEGVTPEQFAETLGKDPMFKAFQPVFKDVGLTQEGADKLMGAWAAFNLAQSQQVETALAENHKALGEAPAQRIEAAVARAKSVLKPEWFAAFVAPFQDAMPAAQVLAIESLCRVLGGDAHGSEGGGGARPGLIAGKTPEELSKMKPGDRLKILPGRAGGATR